mmetsp:Transcript_27404/g.32396  ORF Transcript_27404/g.32396 Transcript_27404/m.32396 type:complete len:104 (-) Transcript_27404:313-624(-)
MLEVQRNTKTRKGKRMVLLLNSENSELSPDLRPGHAPKTNNQTIKIRTRRIIMNPSLLLLVASVGASSVPSFCPSTPSPIPAPSSLPISAPTEERTFTCGPDN